MDINVSISQPTPDIPALIHAAIQRLPLAMANRAAKDIAASAYTPRWQGTLANSFVASQTAAGAQAKSTAQHAWNVHEGRQPGKWPNITAIENWASSKGMAGAGWAIARKIADSGIKGRPFVQQYVSSLALEASLKEEIRHVMA